MQLAAAVSRLTALLNGVCLVLLSESVFSLTDRRVLVSRCWSQGRGGPGTTIVRSRTRRTAKGQRRTSTESPVPSRDLKGAGRDTAQIACLGGREESVRESVRRQVRSQKVCKAKWVARFH